MILVTGCNGYIGRHVAQHLYDMGLEVVGVDREGLPIDGIGFVKRQLDKPNSCSDLRQVSKVIHLAACKQVGGSRFHLRRDNFHATRHLLEQFPNADWLFTSSAAVYNSGVVDERSLVAPQNYYGYSKARNEQMIYRKVQNATILRLFNVTGGKLPAGDQSLVGILNQVTEKNLPVKFEVPLVDTFDGSPIRTFVHVDDVANIIGQWAMKPGRDMFNVGATTSSVRNLIDVWNQVHNAQIRPQLVNIDEPGVVQSINMDARARHRFNIPHRTVTEILESVR